jgi:Spy/CpxP family protein refolding chaperone
MQPIFVDYMKKEIQLKSQIEVAQIDLWQLMMQDKVDTQKVNKQVNMISEAKGDLLEAQTHALLAVRDVLTPEQRSKMQMMMMKMPLMSGGMGMGDGGGMRRPMPMQPGMMPPPGGTEPQMPAPY